MAKSNVIGGVATTTLSSAVDASETAWSVASGVDYPDGSNGVFYLVVDFGLSSQEVVKCSGRSGNTITVSERGADGSTASAHDSGATVEHIAAAEALNEAFSHANATTGTPHGTVYMTPAVHSGTTHTTAMIGDGQVTDAKLGSGIDPTKLSSGTASINITGNAATADSATTATTADSATTAGSATTATSASTANLAGNITDEWSDWTPVITGWSAGNATIVARYAQTGKTVHVQFRFEAGTTTTFDTAFTATLPVTAARVLKMGHVGIAHDVGVGVVAPVMLQFPSDTTFAFYPMTSLNARDNSGLRTDFPFTWASTDVIEASFTYEALTL